MVVHRIQIDHNQRPSSSITSSPSIHPKSSLPTTAPVIAKNKAHNHPPVVQQRAMAVGCTWPTSGSVRSPLKEKENKQEQQQKQNLERKKRRQRQARRRQEGWQSEQLCGRFLRGCLVVGFGCSSCGDELCLERQEFEKRRKKRRRKEEEQNYFPSSTISASPFSLSSPESGSRFWFRACCRCCSCFFCPIRRERTSLIQKGSGFKGSAMRFSIVYLLSMLFLFLLLLLSLVMSVMGSNGSGRVGGATSTMMMIAQPTDTSVPLTTVVNEQRDSFDKGSMRAEENCSENRRQYKKCKQQPKEVIARGAEREAQNSATAKEEELAKRNVSKLVQSAVISDISQDGRDNENRRTTAADSALATSVSASNSDRNRQRGDDARRGSNEAYMDSAGLQQSPSESKTTVEQEPLVAAEGAVEQGHLVTTEGGSAFSISGERSYICAGNGDKRIRTSELEAGDEPDAELEGELELDESETHVDVEVRGDEEQDKTSISKSGKSDQDDYNDYGAYVLSYDSSSGSSSSNSSSADRNWSSNEGWTRRTSIEQAQGNSTDSRSREAHFQVVFFAAMPGAERKPVEGEEKGRRDQTSLFVEHQVGGQWGSTPSSRSGRMANSSSDDSSKFAQRLRASQGGLSGREAANAPATGPSAPPGRDLSGEHERQLHYWAQRRRADATSAASITTATTTTPTTTSTVQLSTPSQPQSLDSRGQIKDAKADSADTLLAARRARRHRPDASAAKPSAGRSEMAEGSLAEVAADNGHSERDLQLLKQLARPKYWPTEPKEQTTTTTTAMDEDDVKWLSKMNERRHQIGPKEEEQRGLDPDRRPGAVEYSRAQGQARAGDANQPVRALKYSSKAPEVGENPLTAVNGTVESAPTEVDSSKEQQMLTHNVYYWRLIWFILPVGATFGNLLVIMAVYRERSLQSVTNYFIVSLALADFLVGLIVMPFAVYVLVNEVWELSDAVCDIYVAVDVTSSTASILNLVAISIDRYRAVAYPIAYSARSNSTRAFITICLVWLISICVGAPIMMGLNTTPERKSSLCILYNSTFIFWSSLTSFYVPCIIMVGLYWRIFAAIRTRTKKVIQASSHQHGQPQQLKQAQQQPAITSISKRTTLTAPIAAPSSPNKRPEVILSAEFEPQDRLDELALVSFKPREMNSFRRETRASDEQQQIALSDARGEEEQVKKLKNGCASSRSCDQTCPLASVRLEDSKIVTLERLSRAREQLPVPVQSGPERSLALESLVVAPMRLEGADRAGGRRKSSGNDVVSATVPENAATATTIERRYMVALERVGWCECSQVESGAQASLEDCRLRLASKICALNSIATPITKSVLDGAAGERTLPGGRAAVAEVVETSAVSSTPNQLDLAGVCLALILQSAAHWEPNWSLAADFKQARQVFMELYSVSAASASATEVVAPATLTNANIGSREAEVDSALIRLRCQLNAGASGANGLAKPLETKRRQEQELEPETEAGADAKTLLQGRKERQKVKAEDKRRQHHKWPIELNSTIRQKLNSLLCRSNLLLVARCQLMDASIIMDEQQRMDERDGLRACLCCGRIETEQFCQAEANNEKHPKLSTKLSICLTEPLKLDHRSIDNGSSSSRNTIELEKVSMLMVDDEETGVKLTQFVRRPNAGSASNQRLKTALTWCPNIAEASSALRVRNSLVELDCRNFNLSPEGGGQQAGLLCRKCRVSCLMCASIQLDSNNPISSATVAAAAAPTGEKEALTAVGNLIGSSRKRNADLASAEATCANLSRLLKEEKRASSKLSGDAETGGISAYGSDNGHDDEAAQSSDAESSDASRSSSSSASSARSSRSSRSRTTSGRRFRRSGSDSDSLTGFDCSARHHFRRHSSRQTSCCENGAVGQASYACAACERLVGANHMLSAPPDDWHRKVSSTSTELRSGESCGPTGLWSSSIAPCTTYCECSLTGAGLNADDSPQCRQPAAPTELGPSDQSGSTLTAALDGRQLHAALPVAKANAISSSPTSNKPGSDEQVNGALERGGMLQAARAKIKRRSIKLSQIIRGRLQAAGSSQPLPNGTEAGHCGQQSSTCAISQLATTNGSEEEEEQLSSSPANARSAATSGQVASLAPSGSQMAPATATATETHTTTPEELIRSGSSTQQDNVKQSAKDIQKHSLPVSASAAQHCHHISGGSKQPPASGDQLRQHKMEIKIVHLDEAFTKSTKLSSNKRSYLVSTVINLMHLQNQQQQTLANEAKGAKLSARDRRSRQELQATSGRQHRAGSRRRREKNAARRERKATKTLAIVLGIFLACWTPFFTCNIIDGVCIQLNMDCRPGMRVYLITSWLGYINSCVNPIIYTIFNMDFRRAFKKILTSTPNCCKSA